MKACDVEIGNIRSLGCWEVLPRSSLPQNTSVMEIRRTCRYKTNELGTPKSVSHRSRFVAKGYSQDQGLHYFENYALVASFITMRLLFALTSIPNFKVLQYDVSVAFIQSKLDSNYPLVCSVWMCQRIRRSPQICLSTSPSSIWYKRQFSGEGSALRNRLYRLRSNTLQKRRMRLR